MSEILITGGAGYLGSVLVPQLIENGHNVTVIDSFMYGQNSLLSLCSSERFNVINGDVRDRAVLSQGLKNAEFILPLAALVGFPLCEKRKHDAESVNLGAIKEILSLRDKSQRIIFPCTNSGYGAGKTEKIYTEESPLEPVSLYGQTKVEAEKIVLESENAMSFRFATLFGASPRMRTDLLVNDFVFRAVRDRSVIVFEGNNVRNYLHVSDAARAFCFAIDNFERLKGSPYNCGLSNANLTKIDLCKKIKEHIPQFVYIESEIGEDPDKRDYFVSNSKIEKAGFLPQISLDEGIEELIKAYRIINNVRYGNS